MKDTKNKKLLWLAFWLILSFLISWFGAQFSTGKWYFELNKPIWTPPGWIFGPVWGLLYLLMAISAWLISRLSNPVLKNQALQLYLLKMIINGLWSYIFFGLKEIGWALIDIAVLELLIIIIAIKFYRINKTAGLLLVPYLLWVSFATILNLKIWILN